MTRSEPGGSYFTEEQVEEAQKDAVADARDDLLEEGRAELASKIDEALAKCGDNDPTMAVNIVRGIIGQHI